MARSLLTELAIRIAKPKVTPYRLRDGEGLFLYVPPSGIRAWQFRYELNGKQQGTTLGKLDSMSLAEARVKAKEARRLVAQGEHVTTAKRLAKAAAPQALEPPPRRTRRVLGGLAGELGLPLADDR